MILRDKLVNIALEWQDSFGVAPSITSALSEYDAAMLVGMPENEYSEYMKDKTAVSKGADFVFNNIRYQVKANRPSGKKGSFVTMVPKASNYEWDKLIWILYDKNYVIQEAWEWCVKDYILKLQFAPGIKAGFPSPAEDYSHETLDFNRDLIRNPSMMSSPSSTSTCVTVRTAISSYVLPTRTSSLSVSMQMMTLKCGAW